MLGLFKKIWSRPAAPVAAPVTPPAPIARPAATPPPPLPRPAARGPIRGNPVTPNTITPKIPTSIPTPNARLSRTATARPTPSVQQPVDPSTQGQIAPTAIAATLREALSHKVPA